MNQAVAALPRAEGARLLDAALTAYGRSFEHPCKIRFVRWLAPQYAELCRRLPGERAAPQPTRPQSGYRGSGTILKALSLSSRASPAETRACSGWGSSSR